MAVVAVSVGVFAGCGVEAPGQVSQGLESGGSMKRTSLGRAGLESDIAYFRELLAALKTEKEPDRQAIAQVGGLVARLEGLVPKDSGVTLQAECGTSGWGLSASVSLGYTMGSATANAGYVEFGPPSPYSKTLFTQAWASSSAGTQYDSHEHTYSGAGTFNEPAASAQTGPTYNCKRLFAYSSISSNDCPGGFYAAESDDYDSCQF
jgi:hypothetical protein